MSYFPVLKITLTFIEGLSLLESSVCPFINRGNCEEVQIREKNSETISENMKYIISTHDLHNSKDYFMPSFIIENYKIINLLITKCLDLSTQYFLNQIFSDISICLCVCLSLLKLWGLGVSQFKHQQPLTEKAIWKCTYCEWFLAWVLQFPTPLGTWITKNLFLPWGWFYFLFAVNKQLCVNILPIHICFSQYATSFCI